MNIRIKNKTIKLCQHAYWLTLSWLLEELIPHHQ
jgi:hypothetical protein